MVKLKRKILNESLLYIINLFILFLLPSILCATDNLKLANELREQIYGKTTIAATSETLYPIDYSLSAEEIINKCDEQGLGLWCAGIAFVYYSKLKENGIPAYILSIGFPNKFTHAMVLVKSKEKLYIQDPYLNYTFKEDLLTVLDILSQKKIPNLSIGETKYRPVAVNKKLSLREDMWATKRINTSILKKTVGDSNIYFSDTSLNTFERYYSSNSEKEAFKKLQNLGFPRKYFYFYLFPFAIFGSDGYCEDVNSEINQALLKKLILKTHSLLLH